MILNYYLIGNWIHLLLLFLKRQIVSTHGNIYFCMNKNDEENQIS